MIGYAVFVFGAVFYAFTITNLLTEIKEENFARSFLRIVDTDSNGIINKKEITDFAPCPDYDAKKIKKVFADYGRRADINDLTLDFDSKTIINALKPCVGDVESFTTPDHLKHLKQSHVQEEMMNTYDLNHDDIINWGEYNIANRTLKKQLPYARTVFRFFDKNHDWKIKANELKKVKVKQLATYIGSGGKRRK